MLEWLKPDRFLVHRLRHNVANTFVTRPARLPNWLLWLIPASKRRLLTNLKRIDASPFGRAAVLGIADRTLTMDAGDRVDFATGCYLGLDFDLVDDDIAAVRAGGLRNGWSRASGVTPITRALETALAERTGFDTCRIGASISLINYTIFHSLKLLFPVVVMDADAHMTLKRGVRAAYSDPSTIRAFPCNDTAALEAELRALPADLPKLVVVDGVYSMRGVRAPLRAILDLCAAHNAVCYVDDAHGMGITGDRGLGAADALTEADRTRTILVGGFSKACSNPVAFVAFPQRLWYGVDPADFLTFCGPPSNLHAVVALRHLRAFDTPSYAERRALVRERSERLHRRCDRLGIAVFSEPGLPILSVRITEDAMEDVVGALDAHGIFAKVAIHPVARVGEECVRFCITSLHTDAQIARLAEALEAIAHRCLRIAGAEQRPGDVLPFTGGRRVA